VFYLVHLDLCILNWVDIVDSMVAFFNNAALGQLVHLPRGRACLQDEQTRVNFLRGRHDRETRVHNRREARFLAQILSVLALRRKSRSRRVGECSARAISFYGLSVTLDVLFGRQVVVGLQFEKRLLAAWFDSREMLLCRVLLKLLGELHDLGLEL
jgi:hypothetical protein